MNTIVFAVNVCVLFLSGYVNNLCGLLDEFKKITTGACEVIYHLFFSLRSNDYISHITPAEEQAELSE